MSRQAKSQQQSTALLTDHYELTMVDAALAAGLAERRAVFEVFARHLPDGRRYGVVAGTGRALDAVERFRFDAQELDWLAGKGFLCEGALDRLARLRFGGRIDGYAEGELWFPGSPVLTVEAPLVEALVLETVLLSTVDHDSAVAAAASRMRLAAGARALLGGGARRTHEEAAVAAARATWVAGFDATSNLAAARRHGVPSGGTVAHSFIMANRDERDAFSAQLATQGPGTTFLVDTYDIDRAIRTAVDVAGPHLGGIRLDSGDVEADARRARALLDDLGATQARIVVSGDMDEHRIPELADAPIDTFLVGTRVVTGSGAPTAGFVYKLVAIAENDAVDAPMRSVAKASVGKASIGGRKQAHRVLDAEGVAVAEHVSASGEGPAVPSGGRALSLQAPLVEAGERVAESTAAEGRAHHHQMLSELGADARRLDPGPPALEAGDASSAQRPTDG